MSIQDENIMAARRVIDQADEVVALLHEINAGFGAPATFNGDDVDTAMSVSSLVIDSPKSVRIRVINLLGDKFDRFTTEKRFT